MHDDSAVRFFLVYNRKLKLFHYVLDETAPATEVYAKGLITDRITIGNRTGFAYYKDHKRERKILIGVFEGNSRVNNYFDGPFDQLPDNFIEGETLRDAILDIEPSLKGKIDRFGSTPDGADRFPDLALRALPYRGGPPAFPRMRDLQEGGGGPVLRLLRRRSGRRGASGGRAAGKARQERSQIGDGTQNGKDGIGDEIGLPP